MPGALMQLVAYGAQDIYLSGNPQMTFFKTVYRRHTNFSMECIKQDLKGTPGEGSRVIAALERRGDLVHDCFIKLQSDIENAGNNPGHNIIDYTEVEIGGQSIDKHFGHWMEAHAELTEKPGRINGAQLLLNSNNKVYESLNVDIEAEEVVVGHDVTPNMFQLTSGAGGVEMAESSKTVNLMIPLRFWFNRHIGLSLPLIALQYHKVNIIVKFSSGAGTRNIFTNINKFPTLWCNYIYLDTDERRRFAQVSHEYLIEQVQTQSFTGTGNQTIKLNFNHPVKELVWGLIQNWGGDGTNDGIFKRFHSDLNSTTQLKLNGHDRFEKLEPEYFSRYQIYKYHTGIPSTRIRDPLYVYSFALKPEEHQPSGTCNFSRIDNAQLLFSNLNSDTHTRYIYAINYNVLRIMSGMGGLAYSN